MLIGLRDQMMTYYAFHAREFLLQTKMADGDDVIRKACENFSLHLKYPLTFRPEQRQVVEPLLQGKDVLAITQTGYSKSMIFQVDVAGAALKVKEHQTVFVVCPLGCIISLHTPTSHERASSQAMFLWVTSISFLCLFH